MEAVQTTPTHLELRVIALEELVAQLVLVLEGTNKTFTAERLGHWMNICIDRMHTTGSASSAEIVALQVLTDRVTA